MKPMSLAVVVLLAFASVHDASSFSVRFNNTKLRGNVHAGKDEPAGCESSTGLHICQCCNFRHEKWTEGKCNVAHDTEAQATPCKICCTAPTGTPECATTHDYEKIMISGNGRDIYTSVGGVLYWIPTCEACGYQWCGNRATDKTISRECADQPDGVMDTGEWMSSHPVPCSQTCSGAKDYQKLMISGDSANIYTSVDDTLYHIPTCNACGQNWCGGRATDRTLDASCAEQPDGNANTGEWMSTHPVPCSR